MNDLGIDLSDAPTLARFFRSNAPVRLIMGPMGSGKSSVSCVEIARRASETPASPDGIRRSRWAVVRNTYPELRDTTIKTFKQWIPPTLGRWHESSSTFRLRINLPDGTAVDAEVLFRALDRPDDISKLLSLELTGAYFNEWREIPRAVFDTMTARIGRYPRADEAPGAWSGIWGDTNPPDEDHYLYRIFEEERPAGFEIFKQPSGRSAAGENRAHLKRCPGATRHPVWVRGPNGRWERDDSVDTGTHLIPCVCYYEQMLRGKRDDWIKVNVDGEYGIVADGRPIFPEYNDAVHTAKDPIPVIPSAVVFIGNDYGTTPAAVWVQRDPADGQLQVVREYVAERMGALGFGAEQLRICKTEFPTNPVEGWGDPAGMQMSQTDERTPIEIVNAAGVPMAPAHTNDLEVRWETVRSLLLRLTWMGRPALAVSPSCRKLRKALAGRYCLKRLQVSGDERYRDAPIKDEFSHVAEALQYALLGAGEDRTVLSGGRVAPDGIHRKIRVKRSVGRHR